MMFNFPNILLHSFTESGIAGRYNNCASLKFRIDLTICDLPVRTAGQIRVWRVVACIASSN
jgi:hypothetical protein